MKEKTKGNYRLLVAGAAVFLLLSVPQVVHCLDQWENDYKAQAFETFWAYFFSVSKGAVLISAAVAAALIGVGYFCGKRKNKRNENRRS